MTITFGALNIQIPDGATPSAPSSGVTLFSASGALSYINATENGVVVNTTTPAAGDILLGTSTEYARFPIDTTGKVLISSNSTVSYTNPTSPTVGIANYVTATPCTVTNAAITENSSVILTAVGQVGGFTITNISAGSFTFGSLVATNCNVMYMFL